MKDQITQGEWELKYSSSNLQDNPELIIETRIDTVAVKVDGTNLGTSEDLAKRIQSFLVP